MASLENSLKTVVKVFRRECHRVLESEMTTIRGADSMLIALQLVMAEANKTETGEFTVALSDVIVTWQRLLREKLHLPLSDSAHPENYDIIRREYDSFLKRTNTLDLIDVSRMYQQLRAESDPDEPLSSVELLQFLSGGVESSTDCLQTPSSHDCPQTPSRNTSQYSLQVQGALRRLFCSYLELLVNTRNDLALAQVLDAPCRGLSCVAFTNLKRQARASGTSLFLAAVSFVRAIQLGGKGYAPPDSHPLRGHLKGLSDFVRFTDHLQELMGETPDPSVAGEKLVSVIRAALVKGLSSEHPVLAGAEGVACDLKRRMCQILDAQRGAACDSGISPARPKVHAINHATAYGGRATVKVLKALLDEEALSPPCRNKAELLYRDQAPIDAIGETCILTLFRSPEAPTGCSPQALRQRVQKRAKPKVSGHVIRSQFACTYGEEERPLSRVLRFPTRGGLEGEGAAPFAAAECEKGSSASSLVGQRVPLGSRGTNIRPGAAGDVGEACKRRRVEEEGEVERQPQKKRTLGTGVPRRPGKSGDRAAPAKQKLISGQSKLTSFFRV
ncbi:PCNA-interacting partner [Paramormyrops kingsleyae]|uniref:PCNA-interacting partner n=1 Tax=Paramormyrops kingsleyae TaxID=1676925 RepID=A0A3B3RUL1_9TELE|nr:PCNA-interacting partner [Paramormyrops kingsleyae]